MRQLLGKLYVHDVGRIQNLTVILRERRVLCSNNSKKNQHRSGAESSNIFQCSSPYAFESPGAWPGIYYSA